MDAEAVDKDVLVLRFYVEEEDRSGPMRVVELVPNGQNIVVNSTNYYGDQPQYLHPIIFTFLPFIYVLE